MHKHKRVSRLLQGTSAQQSELQGATQEGPGPLRDEPACGLVGAHEDIEQVLPVAPDRRQTFAVNESKNRIQYKLSMASENERCNAAPADSDANKNQQDVDAAENSKPDMDAHTTWQQAFDTGLLALLPFGGIVQAAPGTAQAQFDIVDAAVEAGASSHEEDEDSEGEDLFDFLESSEDEEKERDVDVGLDGVDEA